VIVGVPKEIKREERRVAVTPAGVVAFVSHGHRVIVERGAGLGSGIDDGEFVASGATLVETARELWNNAEMILKVKEPLEDECLLFHEGQILFTYLHLAANDLLTNRILAAGIIACGYETIQLDDGSLPLLAPMSEVAGRLSIQVGAHCLEVGSGGMGILLSGVSGVPSAKVTIIGAGVAGINACHVAVGVGARVAILDVYPPRLAYVRDIMHGQLTTVMSNRANIEEEVMDADLVIGAALIPGTKAPRLITEDMVRRMKAGSVIVDIAVDQGGICETTHPTTLDDPAYIVHGVVHYSVANMPGAVPRTSTYALTNSTLSYALEIADHGLEEAMRRNHALRRGLNIYKGKVMHAGVAEAFGLPYDEMYL
jgi:alanine dehydrogenase